jgi:hypothetical protein
VAPLRTHPERFQHFADRGPVASFHHEVEVGGDVRVRRVELDRGAAHQRGAHPRAFERRGDDGGGEHDALDVGPIRCPRFREGDRQLRIRHSPRSEKPITHNVRGARARSRRNG